MADVCTYCGKAHHREDSRNGKWWWNLSNYFGINGFFCSDCYELVSHDSYKQPRNPGAYLMVLLKLTGAKNG